MVIILTIYLILFQFINIPNKIKKKWRRFFSFFLLIYILHLCFTKKTKLNNNSIITVRPCLPLYNLLKCNFLQLYINISVPTLRFFTISIIYLITIQTVLLTTPYEIIIHFFIYNIRLIHSFSIKRNFIIMISAQFLKIVFLELNKSKISYSIRCTRFTNDSTTSYRIPFLNYYYVMKNYCHNLFQYVNYITYSLHSRSIYLQNLFFFNINK